MTHRNVSPNSTESVMGVGVIETNRCEIVQEPIHCSILVSQCSATRDTVAATPPVARHDFMRYAWPTSGATPPQKGATGPF